MVSGVDQLAYRIQGNACPGTVVPSNIDNDYDNNEAHSASSGANLWPMDKGFDYDQGLFYFSIDVNNYINDLILF